MQNHTPPESSPARAKIAGLLLFFGLGTGTEWLLHQQAREQAAWRKAQAAAHGEKIRARIEGELDAMLATSACLAGYWAVRPGFPSAAEADRILAEHYRRSRHVRSFAITDGYRIAQAFPPGDEGQPLGLDYREQAGQWPAIQHSVETRTPLLEGPTPPTLAIRYRVPIFIGEEFRGLLSTLIDGASLLATDGFSHEDYQYALKADPDPAPGGKTVLGADGLFSDPAAATVNIAAPGGDWQLAVKPKAPAPAWPGLARVLGWLLAGLFAAQTASWLELNRKLSGLALYDRLTGLPSRNLFLDRLKQMIRRTKRNRGCFSVLFINLNEFKSINHARGERVGDMMLAGIGKRLSGSIRHCDTVTRWGGDEFVILLDACPLDQASLIAENLRHKIELPVAYGGAELRIGAAIGAATFPDDGRSLATLLKIAGQRMLKDKNRRKGGPDLPAQSGGGDA